MGIRLAAFITALLTAASVSAQQYSARGNGASLANYVIGAHDVLVITSYDDQDLTGKFTVETDGTFTFPMLGRVKAAGMTLRDTETALKASLVERGLFMNPDITVTVDQYRSQKIFILGEVRKPGVYTMSGSMNLIEALALADSTLPTAGTEAIIVHRANERSAESQQNAVHINLRDLQSGSLLQNLDLGDGDTILVPRAQNIYVFGQVKTPGAFPMPNEDVTVLQALSLAGGVTDRGSMGRIEIMRTVDGKQEKMDAELTDTLKAGDTLIVPERFF